MRALVRLAWVDVKLFVREPLTAVVSLLLPLIILFVLGGVFGNEANSAGEEVVYRGIGPMSYYVPAYVALVVASVCVISIPTHMAGNRERGVLKRLRASAVRARTVAGAQVAVGVVLSSVSAMLLLGAATLAYDFDAPRSIVAAIGVFGLLNLGFSAFGLLLGAVMPTARAAQAVGMVIWFVMLFLGGAGPPPEVLTDTMRTVSDMTVLWHGVKMMHDAWLGLDAGLSWLVFAVTAGLSAILAGRLFRWE